MVRRYAEGVKWELKTIESNDEVDLDIFFNVNVITEDTIAIICQDKDKLIHLKPNKAEIEFISSVGFYENSP